ncbi:T9SS type A sorting domain-containing protein [Aquimarina agarilytica]|uniref:T9SS type A sorting domain-containing protein n=1 Tax=Aquimarina agarilytica TaxID=1087449 RepID=UPI000289A761|nr:T9SS type A sorting domain-containing protein [Aquimarina agarilytica]
MKKIIFLLSVSIFSLNTTAQSIEVDTQGVDSSTSLMQGESFDMALTWDTNGNALIQNGVNVEIVLLNTDPFSQTVVANGDFIVEAAGGATTGTSVITTITIPEALAPSNTLAATERYILNIFMQAENIGFVNATGINGSPNARFTLNVTENPTLSTNDFDLPEDVSLSPNPIQGGVVTVNSTVDEVTITNIVGQIVLKTKENSFDVSGLASGLYFVKISSEVGQGVRKLIVL